MRFSALGTAASLWFLGIDCSAAAARDDERVAISGFSKAIRGDGFLAVPVGTVQRPVGQKREAKAYEDKLYNMNFFYATDGESPVIPVDSIGPKHRGHGT